MIDAWDIYWVMQLDAIRFALFGVTFWASAMIIGLGMMSFGEAVWDEEKDRVRPWVKRLTAVAIAGFVAGVFVPKSQTVAAMIVLPAITSDAVVQTVAPEARELYELAKDALRSVAKDKPAKEGDAK